MALKSHWPCVEDFVVHPLIVSNAFEREMSGPSMVHYGQWSHVAFCEHVILLLMCNVRELCKNSLCCMYCWQLHDHGCNMWSCRRNEKKLLLTPEFSLSTHTKVATCSVT